MSVMLTHTRSESFGIVPEGCFLRKFRLRLHAEKTGAASWNTASVEIGFHDA